MTMGRPPGSLNKKTILKQERQGKHLKRMVGAAKEPVPEVAGARQFDSLVELRRIAQLQLGMAARQQARMRSLASADGEVPAKEEQRFADLIKDARATLKDIAPYEHAQMRSVTVTPPPLDLTRLTDEQLRVFTALYAVASGDAGSAEDGAGQTRQ